MSTKKQLYNENGVFISKYPLSVGDEVILSYNGLLANSGAEDIYVYLGYGDKWQSKEFIPMTWEEGAFRTKIKINMAEDINITFKDSADNWDNNSMQNYSFKINTTKSTTKSNSSSCKSCTDNLTNSLDETSMETTSETKKKTKSTSNKKNSTK